MLPASTLIINRKRVPIMPTRRRRIVSPGRCQSSGLDSPLDVGLVEITQAHPRETHLIDRPLPVAHPVLWIWVVLIVVAVVVPGGDVNDRSGGQQWSGLLRVGIGDAPAILVIAYATQRLGLGRAGTRRVRPDVRVDRLHALSLAASVKVWLKRR